MVPDPKFLLFEITLSVISYIIYAKLPFLSIPRGNLSQFFLAYLECTGFLPLFLFLFMRVRAHFFILGGGRNVGVELLYVVLLPVVSVKEFLDFLACTSFSSLSFVACFLCQQ